MKLKDYLDERCILILEQCPDTDAFYQEFSQLLKNRGLIENARNVKRLFQKREAMQSTAIGKGAAAPHIYGDEFSCFLLTAAVVRCGIDFKAPDGSKVGLIFLIMSDDRDIGLHLKSLARISRLVDCTDVVASVRNLSDPQQIYQTILAKEKELDPH